jgi:hypothetical protein
MGSDDLFHRRKARLARSHRREMAKRAPCEGTKTEPDYFREFRNDLGLNPANVVIEDRKSGLDPNRLVDFALQTFNKGRDFDDIFCVFDKDKHASYAAALAKIRTSRQRGARLHAVTSVPCFEIWLLLHFAYTTRSFVAAGGNSNCDLVVRELRRKGYLLDYEKGKPGLFPMLRDRLDTAITNAIRLEVFHKTSGTDNPSTEVHKLISHLKGLERSKG